MEEFSKKLFISLTHGKVELSTTSENSLINAVFELINYFPQSSRWKVSWSLDPVERDQSSHYITISVLTPKAVIWRRQKNRNLKKNSWKQSFWKSFLCLTIIQSWTHILWVYTTKLTSLINFFKSCCKLL